MTWDKEKIKILRKSLGLSQAEFAHQLGCRQQTVSEWELGLYAPANAYGKLLDTFEFRKNNIAPKLASWLPTPVIQEAEEMELDQASEEFTPREFDPAID